MSQAIPCAGGYSNGQSQDVQRDAEPLINAAMPAWFDMAAPWMASIVFHLGVGLLVLFLSWFIIKAARAVFIEPIVIPNSFADPDTPGGVPNPGELNSDRDPSQYSIKDVMRKDGWMQTDSPKLLTSFLSGSAGEKALDGIFRGGGGGIGGSTGTSMGGGPIAPYDANGGGMGGGPRSNFFGSGGSAAKIVYVIDHSGSLLDNFDYLREEIKKSVNKLVPVQQFAVVAFASDAEVLGPPNLQRPTPDVKRDLANRLDMLKAQAQNDDQLQPFQNAFEKAFAMKPQLIYFLTDGKFDPKLAEVVKMLNRDHKVKINTLAFVHEEPDYKVQMQDMAKQNGGTYKFVAEKDLGN